VSTLTCYVGVDVSKERLDVAWRDEGRQSQRSSGFLVPSARSAAADTLHGCLPSQGCNLGIGPRRRNTWADYDGVRYPRHQE
jgi:hypothetical protein